MNFNLVPEENQEEYFFDIFDCFHALINEKKTLLSLNSNKIKNLRELKKFVLDRNQKMENLLGKYKAKSFSLLKKFKIMTKEENKGELQKLRNLLNKKQAHLEKLLHNKECILDRNKHKLEIITNFEKSKAKNRQIKQIKQNSIQKILQSKKKIYQDLQKSLSSKGETLDKLKNAKDQQNQIISQTNQRIKTLTKKIHKCEDTSIIIKQSTDPNNLQNIVTSNVLQFSKRLKTKGKSPAIFDDEQHYNTHRVDPHLISQDMSSINLPSNTKNINTLEPLENDDDAQNPSLNFFKRLKKTIFGSGDQDTKDKQNLSKVELLSDISQIKHALKHVNNPNRLTMVPKEGRQSNVELELENYKENKRQNKLNKIISYEKKIAHLKQSIMQAKQSLFLKKETCQKLKSTLIEKEIENDQKQIEKKEKKADIQRIKQTIESNVNKIAGIEANLGQVDLNTLRKGEYFNQNKPQNSHIEIKVTPSQPNTNRATIDKEFSNPLMLDLRKLSNQRLSTDRVEKFDDFVRRLMYARSKGSVKQLKTPANKTPKNLQVSPPQFTVNSFPKMSRLGMEFTLGKKKQSSHLKVNSPKPTFDINSFGSKMDSNSKKNDSNSNFWDNDDLTYKNFEKTKSELITEMQLLNNLNDKAKILESFPIDDQNPADEYMWSTNNVSVLFDRKEQERQAQIDEEKTKTQIEEMKTKKAELKTKIQILKREQIDKKTKIAKSSDINQSNLKSFQRAYLNLKLNTFDDKKISNSEIIKSIWQIRGLSNILKYRNKKRETEGGDGKLLLNPNTLTSMSNFYGKEQAITGKKISFNKKNVMGNTKTVIDSLLDLAIENKKEIFLKRKTEVSNRIRRSLTNIKRLRQEVDVK